MSNSSISNSELYWKRLLLAGLAAAVVTSLLVLGTVTVIDPYDVFSFSPSFDRQPITGQRGLSVAALARKSAYDSAALGSSTVELLDPVDLNTLFGGSFVNLSIWGGSAWEQNLAGQLFARHHPFARTIILGIDSYWCGGGIQPRMSPNQFQEWMYRETSPADIPRLFHMAALWDSWEQLDYIRHLRKSAAAVDGFEDIFAHNEYSLKRARERIYGTPEPKPIPVIDQAEVATLSKNHPYPNHVYLPEILDALPLSTAKILYFVPLHIYGLNSAGTDTVAMYEGCKSSIVEIAKRYRNILVLDFMIDSPMTRDDQNFWDRAHSQPKTGRRTMELTANVLQHGIENRDSVRLLYQAPAGAEGAPK
jgi:hypothetical protein